MTADSAVPPTADEVIVNKADLALLLDGADGESTFHGDYQVAVARLRLALGAVRD